MNFKKICYRGWGSTYFARMKFHKKGRLPPPPKHSKFDTMLLTQSVDDPRSNGGGMELRAINIKHLHTMLHLYVLTLHWNTTF